MPLRQNFPGSKNFLEMSASFKNNNRSKGKKEREKEKKERGAMDVYDMANTALPLGYITSV